MGKISGRYNFLFISLIKIKFLLLNMKERCGIPEKERVVDLCDIDGNLLNVRDELMKNQYGTGVFQPRQLYVLIEVKPSTEEERTTRFVPLLNNSEIITDEFLHNLSPKHPTHKPKYRSHNTRKQSSTRSNSIVAANSGAALPNEQLKNKLRSIAGQNQVQNDRTNRRKSFAFPKS